MKNVKKKFFSTGHRPTDMENCIVDGTWSYIVQLSNKYHQYFPVLYNNKKHSNHHLDIFKFLVSTALKYFGKYVQIINIILLMEILWQVGEKDVSMLVTKPVANLGEQPFLSESVFKKSITFPIFFLHTKELKLPKKV